MDDTDSFVYTRGEEQNNWIDVEKLKQDMSPVTTAECIEYIRKLIDHEIFIYRNNSNVLSEDEIARLGKRRDKIVEALKKQDE